MEEQQNHVPEQQPSPSRNEQINVLIAALGDPSHQQHTSAQDQLVAIGPTAVPALITALSNEEHWLTTFRAAEALGQIGDGRAAGPLIQLLSHPNSNVRWSAIRSLSEVGDTRALLPLRRVAHNDRGKTTWGESVAATAQGALDQMQSRSAFWRFGEPAKTAILIALTLAALIVALDSVGKVRAALSGTAEVEYITPTIVTSTPDPEAEATPEAGEEGEGITTETEGNAEPTPTPTETGPTATPEIQARIVSTANVRAGPGTQHNVVGNVTKDQPVIVLGQQGEWYKIAFDDNEGWVYRTLLSQPSGPVPTIEPES